jgi:membrane protein
MRFWRHHLTKQQWQTLLRRSRQFWGLVISQFIEKALQKSAASLTYVTLFALVPLMTVTYSMLSIIPAFQGLGEDLQEVIFSYVVPEAGLELLDYLQHFSDQARRLTVVGVIFLGVSAYLMLVNIEKNFNAIWGISKGRQGIANFLLYWAVLSLGPLLLGIGLAMSTYLMSLRLFMGEYAVFGVVTWLFQFVPLLLTAMAFTLLFAAVPNCRVPINHALIGGVVTAICFEILKALFGWFVANSAVASIYGAFAVVPLFLLWINLTWMVVLAGAVLVRSIGTYQILMRDRGYPDLLASLVVLWQFYQCSLKGCSLNDAQLLRLGLSSEQWQRIRTVLVNGNIIVATQQGDLVLCRELHQLTLGQLSQMLHIPPQFPAQDEKLKHMPWYETAMNKLGAIDQFTQEQFSQTVADFFEEQPAQVSPST